MFGQDYGETECSHKAGGSRNWYNHFGKPVVVSFFGGVVSMKAGSEVGDF